MLAFILSGKFIEKTGDAGSMNCRKRPEAFHEY
jgi:hypothetical protein